MSADIALRDLRWLHKLLRGFELHAQRAFPHSHFRINLTSTEVKRAKRLADTFGWHVQHISTNYAPVDVPRRNSKPEDPK